MRQLLVKHFVLDYTIKLFGKRLSAPRASRILYPMTVITGYIHTVHLSPFSWVMVGLLFGLYYLGFLHFRIWPAQWDELDDHQKYQYGIFNAGKLTGEQFTKWCEIKLKFEE